MVRVVLKGLNRFVVEDGIVRIYVHEENYRGLRTYWIDKVEIHGSREYTSFIILLRKALKKIKNHEWVIQ
ncbi:MAG: hypothetical protein GXO43_09855 [Crenarchaeota archaeon]|nr:hypothetical protein [Thermoproteota archaeon]